MKKKNLNFSHVKGLVNRIRVNYIYVHNDGINRRVGAGTVPYSGTYTWVPVLDGSSNGG